MSTLDEAPPQKRSSISISQALLMVVVVSVFWSVAACLGSIIAVNGLVAQTPRILNDMHADIIGEEVEKYLLYMYYRDAEAASYLFSYETLNREDLEAQLADHYEWFDGYLDIEITEAEGLPDEIADEGTPYEELMEGRSVTLRGNIEYEGGYTGAFVAVLDYNSGGDYWTISSIDITVPPEKIEADQ